ncbi:hypothetical protein [Streptococcus vestibularis]
MGSDFFWSYVWYINCVHSFCSSCMCTIIDVDKTVLICQ